ncbi:hypothetical protein AKO1_010252, partial [Acrasis kona]
MKRIAKEAVGNMTEKLDDKFSDLMMFLKPSKEAKLPPTHPLRRSNNQDEDPEEETKLDIRNYDASKKEKDSYVDTMRTLVQEARAAPSFEPLSSSQKRTVVDPAKEQARKERMAPAAKRDTHQSADALDDNDLQYLSKYDQEDDQVYSDNKSRLNKDVLFADSRTTICPESYDEFLDYLGDYEQLEQLDFKLFQLQQSRHCFRNIIELFRSEHTTLGQMDVIQSHLFDLAEVAPMTACDEFLHVLGTISSPDYEASFRDVFFFKCCANIFPATDYKHPIMTTISLLLHKHILSCPVEKSLLDQSRALFMLTISHSFNAEPKRFAPEAYSLITKLLKIFIKDPTTYPDSSQVNIEDCRLPLYEKESSTIQPIHVRAFTFNLLDKFISVDKSQTCNAELLQPISKLLNSFKTHQDASKLKEKISLECVPNRYPLSWLVVKAQAIQTFTPALYTNNKGDFSTTYTGPIVDSNQARAAHKILQRKVKREYRGAMRAIRKDNSFIRKAREERDSKEARERKGKYKEIVNQLNAQNREHYQIDHTKKEQLREAKQARKARKQGG